MRRRPVFFVAEPAPVMNRNAAGKIISRATVARAYLSRTDRDKFADCLRRVLTREQALKFDLLRCMACCADEPNGQPSREMQATMTPEDFAAHVYDYHNETPQ